MILPGKTEELGEKLVPLPLFPPQIPHELAPARNQAQSIAIGELN
jgi:hypothetical protein